MVTAGDRVPDRSIRRSRNCACWSANSNQDATADPSSNSTTSTRPMDPASSSRTGAPQDRPASLENAAYRLTLALFHREPGDHRLPVARAHRRSVYRAGKELPVVVVHRHAFRPGAVLAPRRVDVSNLRIAPVAVYDNDTVSRDRSTRWTALADAHIDRLVDHLLPVAIEDREAQHHRGAVRIVRVELVVAAV